MNNEPRGQSAMSAIERIIPESLIEKSKLALQGISSLRSPRRYVNKLSTEDSGTIFLRFAFLAVSYSFFEYCLFSSSANQANWIISSIKIAILEMALPIAMFLIFWIPLKILNHPYPSKIIWGFIFPLRYICFFIVIIFYSLFLFTENYFIAAIRGILLITSSFIILFLFPWFSFNQNKKRIFALCMVGLISCAQIWTFNIVASKLSTTRDRLKEMSLLYDPIGEEVDNNALSCDKEVDQIFDEPHFTMVTNIVFSSVKSHDNNEIELNLKSMLDLQHEWVIDRDHFYEINSRLNSILASNLRDSEFETTKNMINKQILINSDSKEIAELLDRYTKSPSANALIEIMKKFVKLRQTIIEYKDIVIDYSRTRYKVVDLGLMD